METKVNTSEVSHRQRRVAPVHPYVWRKLVVSTLLCVFILFLQVGFLLTWRVHGSALHGDRCTAGREAHANFADESACLMADNIRYEVFTIHRSQEVLKMPSSLHVDFLQLIVLIKNIGTIFLLALTAHQTPTFAGWLQQLCYRSCTRLWHSSFLS
jgi:hypothetical protein